MALTRGQPWLVNALAAKCVDDLLDDRLDLCVEYRGHRYAVELKMRKQLSKDSYAQLAGYLDTLGLSEGWMAVFDSDPARPWEEKIYNRDETFDGKTLHIVGL